MIQNNLIWEYLRIATAPADLLETLCGCANTLGDSNGYFDLRRPRPFAQWFLFPRPGNIITLGATVTLSVATHGGHILLVPATCAITLPTLYATADAAGAGPGSDPNTSSTIGAVFNCSSTQSRRVLLHKRLLAAAQTHSLVSLGVIGTTVDYDAFATQNRHGHHAECNDYWRCCAVAVRLL
jgi:hypothetical protein